MSTSPATVAINPQVAPAPKPTAVSAEAPSQVLARAAAGAATKTDARGRKISVQKITALQLYLLTKILGDGASNAASLNLAMTAASVRDIDGDAIPFPAKESEVQFMLQRLDFEGMAAAAEALAELTPGGGAETAKN